MLASQADTLQGFLARGGVERRAGDPNARHLYMLDESSLASTRQMQSFLEKIGPQDRVLLVGDTRQHQGVDAGKPFEQMQQAGMRTSQLDQIVRQKDPELLRAVEHLSRNETATGIQLLQQQGRIAEIPDPQQRIEAIARDYVARPENTLVVSPDNASRRDINDAIRAELQSSGALSKDNHAMVVLTQRSELTSADRNWAAIYQPADVLYYTRGSKELGLERGTYATVISTNPKANQLTVEREDGQHVTYDPKRLHGIAAYREIARDFAEGDRLQFTVSKPDMDIKNRDLGTVERIDGTSMTVRMDGDKGPDSGIRHLRDAALRPRLRRYVAQLAGNHHGSSPRQYGHHSSPRTHQHALRLCVGLSRIERRANLHEQRNNARRAPQYRHQQSLRCRGRTAEQRNASSPTPIEGADHDKR